MNAGLGKVYILFMLLWLVPVAEAYELRGRVEYVSNGDTFLMIADGVPYKIRLLYIDSPERSRPYYKKSKQMLDGLTTGKDITAKCTWLDSFNRHLCEVFVGGESINSRMIAEGGAWLHIKYYDYSKDPAHLVAVQKKAQQQRVGLWGIAEYQKVLPWEWGKSDSHGGIVSACAEQIVEK